MGERSNGVETERPITPEGRERMRAAGYASLPALLEARRTVTSAKQISVEFEAGLIAELGGEPTPQQRALIISAVASYTAVFITLRKLRTAHRYRVIGDLIGQLTPLQGSLSRALRDLGLSPKSADPADAVPSVEELAAQVDAETAAKRKEKQDGHSPTDG